MFQYTNLNYTLGQEIRLVVLLPGLPSEELRCEIVHVNLKSNPEFEAVSYTWATELGDDTKNEIVRCPDRTTIPITSNCAAALHQLRYITRKRWLWIDAICIHQKNVHERMHQVRLMGQIYSKALRVLICINDPLQDYSQLFEYLRSSSGSTTSMRLQTKRLLMRRWFHRVWVIQEVALARSAVMMCNEHSIFLTDGVIKQLAMALPLGKNLPGPLHWTPGSSIGRDILACLRATSRSSSTEPRDKIYGILNLLDADSRSLIDVDYSSDVAYVYAKAAVAVIKQRRNLEILSCAVTSKQGLYLNRFRLPSWVPDWGGDCSAQHSQFQMEAFGPWKSGTKVAVHDELETEKPNASLESDDVSAKITVSPSSVRIHVRAHFIDIIDD
ncbi:hypothetical protein DM02DRAFT_514345, partial [Periconia macrospinosa]